MKTGHTPDPGRYLLNRLRNLEEQDSEVHKLLEEILEVHEDHGMVEPQEPIETLHEKDSHKRNQHGYESSYKKQKGMALQKECIEEGKGQILTTNMWP